MGLRRERKAPAFLRLALASEMTAEVRLKTGGAAQV